MWAVSRSITRLEVFLKFLCKGYSYFSLKVMFSGVFVCLTVFTLPPKEMNRPFHFFVGRVLRKEVLNCWGKIV